ncbi:AraC family transcriptional regulator [Actinosynnema sp. NPDC047251]|uniref:Transcriptional regulator, AraC family n=1 Tax=Saccharothrix espanaensis (strain ATCC 51144 / DSM 44229 / JCM 9112 / NBRC 15066 / NRRL 15764) TaxID=1179773 RepID=K0K1I6_SACES|nr:AraC family transcriptional regulator [Saccharothrix espanaensis]CCH30438.1 Transcriptional regulator, AraC family [Saccharothrix espanaensis DSM 44229]
MDPFSDVLDVSGVKGTLSTRIEAGGRWAVVLDDYPGVALHAVTAGRAWLTVPGSEPVELAGDDVVLLPAGTPHGLGDEPVDPEGTDRREHATARGRGDGDLIRLGSSPATTRIVTIHYDCDPAALTQVLAILPGIVHVRAETGTTGLDDTVRMLARELAHPQIATRTVLKSLVDVVLVQMLRAWLAEDPPACLGTWLGALHDPVVGKALECLHEDPATPWTTATLAAAISVSRATLARRFPAATGATPAAYLANWRMDLAAVRLRDTHDSLEAIASAVGYGSVPAFSRAFTRAHGRTPGRYRSEARTRRVPAFRLHQPLPSSLRVDAGRAGA